MKKLALFATLLLLVFAGTALAADFPAKNIRLLVPFAAGGGTDAVARALAVAAEKHLGQSVVVMNRTGGSGAVNASIHRSHSSSTQAKISATSSRGAELRSSSAQDK